MVFLSPPGQCFILVPIVQWKSDIIIAQLVASYYYYNYGSLELMHVVCLLCVHGLVRVYVYMCIRNGHAHRSNVVALHSYVWCVFTTLHVQQYLEEKARVGTRKRELGCGH